MHGLPRVRAEATQKRDPQIMMPMVVGMNSSPPMNAAEIGLRVRQHDLVWREHRPHGAAGLIMAPWRRDQHEDGEDRAHHAASIQNACHPMGPCTRGPTTTCPAKPPSMPANCVKPTAVASQRWENPRAAR